MTVDAPVLRPTGVRGAPRPGGVLRPGLLLALAYLVTATWSVGRGFGGYGADGGWIDDRGRPAAHAPVDVVVSGHPALWVLLVLVAILVATVQWAQRGDPQRADVRRFLGIALAAAFVGAVVLVFSALQMGLVQDAFDRGDTHPSVIGNATVVSSHPARAG